MRRAIITALLAAAIAVIAPMTAHAHGLISRGQLPPEDHYTEGSCTGCHDAKEPGTAVPDAHYDYVCVDCHIVDGEGEGPTATDEGPFDVSGIIADITFIDFSNHWDDGWGSWSNDWDRGSDDADEADGDGGSSSTGGTDSASRTRCENGGGTGTRAWVSMVTTDEARRRVYIYDSAEGVETTTFSLNGDSIDRAKFYQIVAGNDYYNDFAHAIGAQPSTYTADVVYYTRTSGERTFDWARSIDLANAAAQPHAFVGRLQGFKLFGARTTIVVRNARGKALLFNAHRNRTAYRVNGKKVSRTTFLVKARRAKRLGTTSVTWSNYKNHGVVRRWASQMSVKIRRK